MSPLSFAFPIVLTIIFASPLLASDAVGPISDTTNCIQCHTKSETNLLRRDLCFLIVQQHIKTLWACDFFTKKVWTLRGPVTFYVLFFIHIHTRRVHVVGMTPNPDGPWMAQQARNMSMLFDDEPEEHKPTHIIRDRDSK